MKTNDVRAALSHKRRKPKPLTKKDYVSTGSTGLNLACTGMTTCGFGKGKYYRFVGDSSSGKTFLSLSCLAEAANNPEFDDYELYFDDAENGAGFDFEFFFGSKMKGRVLPPSGDPDDPQYSTTLEQFYDRLFELLKRKIIYVLDSMDALYAEVDDRKYEKQRKQRLKARATGKEIKQSGDMGMARGKINSSLLRRVVSRLAKTGSILIIVGQTRDKFQAMPMPGADTQTVAGGHALKFYNSLEIWTSIKKRLTTEIRGKKRKQGIIATCRTVKNRQRGVDRRVDVPIYHSYGIDDVGACVDYLVDELHWKKVTGGIRAPEFNYKGGREKLIQHIQNKGLEKKLRLIVRKVWDEIEAECSINRKPRYE